MTHNVVGFTVVQWSNYPGKSRGPEDEGAEGADTGLLQQLSAGFCKPLRHSINHSLYKLLLANASFAFGLQRNSLGTWYVLYT